MEKKKRVVTSIDKISPEVQNAILKKYPEGYSNHIIKVTKSADDFFYAITVDTDDASYLIKVPVKVDTKPKDKNELDSYLESSDNDDDKVDIDSEDAKNIPDDSSLDD